MEQSYEAVRYAADGSGGEPDNGRGADGSVLVTGTLDECRAAIERTIARLATFHPDEIGTHPLAERRWSGLTGFEDADEGVVEGYHESDQEGCGGWVIRRV